jgi:hypothetical protein
MPPVRLYVVVLGYRDARVLFDRNFIRTSCLALCAADFSLRPSSESPKQCQVKTEIIRNFFLSDLSLTLITHICLVKILLPPIVLKNRDSSVGTVAELGLDGSSSLSTGAGISSLLHRVHADSRAHPACHMGTRASPQR